MPVTAEIIEDCRRRFSAGETNEDIIAHLRKCGLSKVETIKVFVDLNRGSPIEAKRLIHLSPAWTDMYQRDEKLHDSAERLARDEAGQNPTSER